MLRNRLLAAAGLLAAAVFIIGIVQLLLLRFAAGDVYPPYSSLRADPLGARAFYESLDSCCGLKVSRNYEPFETLKDRTDSAIIFAGEYPPLEDMLPVVFLEDLEFFLRNGGRIVVTYALPEDVSIARLRKEVEDARKKEEGGKKEKEDKKKSGKDQKEPDNVSFSKRWGLTFRQYPLEGATEAERAEEIDARSLPGTVYWHSSLYFDHLDPAWKVLYEREGKAVVIERRMGKGTVVLCADSYFLSNEALLRHRYPQLLAWLVGDKNLVIFDEYFHGVAANPGVAALARRYRLHGLIAGILALVGLYIWKNSMSFVPPYPDAQEAQEAESAVGKDSSAGLTNLLRRSIPAKDILSVCWQEWKKSQAPGAARAKSQVDRMESVYNAEHSAPPRQRNPVETYNRISHILKER